MLTKYTLKTKILQVLFLFGIGVIYTSCTKTIIAPNPVIKPVPVPPTATADLRDTLANLASVFYLWNNNIPANFAPHTYSATDNLDGELSALKAFSPLNSVTGNHYDHFSFILTEADYQKEFVQGVSTSFGVGFAFDRNDTLRVNYAAHASTAYAQGVRRGWKILAINGIKVATDANTLSQLNTALGGSSASFSFQIPVSNTNQTLSITKQDIPDDEVITTKVFKAGSKTVGYIAYNTFLTQLNKSGVPIHPGMDSSFANLAKANITDIVIDLRYNGGGYTLVSEQMDNALLPASADHQVLYTEHYNDTLNKYYKLGYKNVDHDTTININEANVGNPAKLNVNSVVFIVSDNTASAAELVINSITPYFNGNVKLIGLGLGRDKQYQNTAGKPFGYAGQFGLPAAKPILEAFLINFETKNSLGVDNYVSGFVPDAQVHDGVEFDFGDPREDGLAKALSYESTNSLAYTTRSNQLAIGRFANPSGGAGLAMNPFINNHRFQGMISRSGTASAAKKNFIYQNTIQGKIRPINTIIHH